MQRARNVLPYTADLIQGGENRVRAGKDGTVRAHEQRAVAIPVFAVRATDCVTEQALQRRDFQRALSVHSDDKRHQPSADAASVIEEQHGAALATASRGRIVPGAVARRCRHANFAIATSETRRSSSGTRVRSTRLSIGPDDVVNPPR